MTAFISERPIRICIVDDDDLQRGILHESLDLIPELDVVAQAKNGAEAVDMVKFLHPDIVLMDSSLPVLTGIDATRIISFNFSDTVADTVLMKPFELEDLDRSVSKLLSAKR